MNFDTRIAENRQSATGDARERIAHCCHNASDASLEYRVGAGRSLPVVAAGFQRHDERSTTSTFAGSFEREDLRMRPAKLLMPAFTHELPDGIQHNGADHWIGFHITAAQFGERNCLAHPGFQSIHRGFLNANETFLEFPRTNM